MSDQLLELLVGQVWQVTILAVVVGWLTKTVLRNFPEWSYQLWLVVMVKCVTPPIWSESLRRFLLVVSASVRSQCRRNSVRIWSSRGSPLPGVWAAGDLVGGVCRVTGNHHTQMATHPGANHERTNKCSRRSSPCGETSGGRTWDSSRLAHCGHGRDDWTGGDRRLAADRDRAASST